MTTAGSSSGTGALDRSYLKIRRPFLAALSTPRLIVFFAAFCAFQLAFVFYLKSDGGPASAGLGKLQHWRDHVTSILSQQYNNDDFGGMAAKVSKLATLAEEEVEFSVDNELLEMAVQNLFPWWNADRLRYYPWKRVSDGESAFPLDQKDDHKTGIVICVGNGNVVFAASLIATLRDGLKSKLPIEIAYVGDTDLAPRWRKFLMDMAHNIDIHPLDLTKVFDNGLISLSKYDIKPFSIIASRYPQTILMDADAFFLSSPDDVFETHPGVKETGTLFLHDRSLFNGKPVDRLEWIERQLKAAGRQASERLNTTSLMWTHDAVTESGDSCVVMIDKSRPRLYMSMLFASWMQQKGPRATFDRYFWGDKEVYWIATELTGTPYHFEPWTSLRMAEYPPAITNVTPDTQLQGTCSPHMVHPNANGTAPFIANGAIWKHIGIPEDGLVGWTHMYRGEPMAAAIAAAKAATGVPPDTYWRTDLGEPAKKLYGAALRRTQVEWGGDCRQSEPERWIAVPDAIRRNLRVLRRVGGQVVLDAFGAVQVEVRKDPARLKVGGPLDDAARVEWKNVEKLAPHGFVA